MKTKYPASIFLFALPLTLILSCTKKDENSAANIAVQNYFRTYNERQDFDSFMTFYSDSAVLEDVLLGFRANNKQEISEFYDWTKGSFYLLESDKTLIIESQTVKGNTAITTGYFSKFIFNQDTLGPWKFTIFQKFNNNHKIQYQADWINYTPRTFLEGSDNSNDLIYAK